jgi:Tfp pilus assembly protein PilO
VKTYALRALLTILLSIIVVVGLHLLWKGIFWLSDGMNEMEEQMARQRHQRVQYCKKRDKRVTLSLIINIDMWIN